jgi:PPOX class probable F420-dependent enzyme
MPEIHPKARALLESNALAHVVTLNQDGSPHVSIVWVGLEDGELVTAHLARYQKVANVSRDPRVSISIEGTDLSSRGLPEYLVVEGHARIQEGGAPELLQRLAHVYMGPDVKFPPMDDPPPGYVLRVTPTRFRGEGPWDEH